MGWIRNLLLGEDDDRPQETTTETVPIQPKTHVHGHGCPRDVEGPSVMWLCGNEPRSTPKPGHGQYDKPGDVTPIET